MTSYLSRQFSGFVVPGAETNASASQQYIWQMTDVPMKYILSLADGKVQHDIITVAASGTATLTIPNKYDVTQPLFALILTSGTIKAVAVFASPILMTSTVLIKAGGNQEGMASWVGETTSITLTNPQTAAVTVEYLLYEVPDLTVATSWRIGSQATGISSQADQTPSGWV